MAPEKREQDPPLKKRLREEFYRFSFFQAVSLLEALQPGKKPVGEALRPGDEGVRFRSPPGFAFPASDIAGMEQAEEEGRAELSVTFMGLVGPNGVLPGWYNELAVERIRNKDFSLTSFLDLFHHRLISLFFLAWKKYRLSAVSPDGRPDRISRALLSLIGLGTEGVLPEDGFPPETFIYNSGHLARRIPTAGALEAAVSYYTGAEVEVHQFVDRIIPLDPDDYTMLGMANARLAVDTVCGSEAWENQTKIRLDIGPMSYGSYIRLLPGGDLYRPVVSLVRYMVGIEFDFDLRLVLRKEEVFPCRLGGMETPISPKLGWTTWFATPGETYHENPGVTLQTRLE